MAQFTWPCSDVLLGQVSAVSCMPCVLPYDASSSFWTWAALCAAGTQSWRQRTLEVQRTQTASTQPSRYLWPSHRTPRSQRKRLRWGVFFHSNAFLLTMLLPQSLEGVDEAMIQVTSLTGYQNPANLTWVYYQVTVAAAGLLSSSSSTVFNLSRSWLCLIICKENSNPIW